MFSLTRVRWGQESITALLYLLQYGRDMANLHIWVVPSRPRRLQELQHFQLQKIARLVAVYYWRRLFNQRVTQKADCIDWLCVAESLTGERFFLSAVMQMILSYIYPLTTPTCLVGEKTAPDGRSCYKTLTKLKFCSKKLSNVYESHNFQKRSQTVESKTTSVLHNKPQVLRLCNLTITVKKSLEHFGVRIEALLSCQSEIEVWQNRAEHNRDLWKEMMSPERCLLTPSLNCFIYDSRQM